MGGTTTKDSAFERRVMVQDLPADGLTVEFSAESKELAAIALRIGMPALEHLKIAARIRGVEGGKVIEVTGVLDAFLVQECVATLEPIEGVYNVPLRVLFMDPVRAHQEIRFLDEGTLVNPEEDDIEVLVDGVVDVGEIAVQYLSLALDPYPRKAAIPDVAWRSGDGEAEAEVTENPFSVLNKLRDKT